MSEQRELFPWPPATRSKDPVTSFVADRRAAPMREIHHGRILEALSEPRTADEIAEVARLGKVQVARRLPELQRAGKVRPVIEIVDGAPRSMTRPTPSGRPSRVWERV